MIAIDTNLLVYAHRASTPQHAASRRAIEKALDDRRGCGVSLPSIAEFWSVVTHPSSIGGPSTPAQAEGFIRALVGQSNLRIWMPGDGFDGRLLQMAVRLALSGPRVFDLQIGMIAAENGAEEIWTHDQKFLKIPGLRVHDPL
jgi:predicted nucleic acid-binding protein